MALKPRPDTISGPGSLFHMIRNAESILALSCLFAGVDRKDLRELCFDIVTAMLGNLHPERYIVPYNQMSRQVMQSSIVSERLVKDLRTRAPPFEAYILLLRYVELFYRYNPILLNPALSHMAQWRHQHAPAAYFPFT